MHRALFTIYMGKGRAAGVIIEPRSIWYQVSRMAWPKLLSYA